MCISNWLAMHIFFIHSDAFVNCSPHAVPMADLAKLTNLPVAAEWRILGVKLGVPSHQLNTIQNNCAHYHDYTNQCLTSMFEWWLRNSYESTYESLATALSTIGRRDLALKVCQENSMWVYVLGYIETGLLGVYFKFYVYNSKHVDSDNYAL